MIVTQKMFGYCGRLRAVSLFVNRSAMFVEAVSLVDIWFLLCIVCGSGHIVSCR